MKSQEKAVGVVVIVPANINGCSYAALLQVRSVNDSWAQACQVSAHGKLEPHEALEAKTPEDFKKALCREAIEVDELGPIVGKLIEERQDSLVLVDTKNVPATEEKDGKLVHTFGIEMPLKDLINLDWKRFRLVTMDQLDYIKLLGKDYKKTDQVPTSVTAMFEDEVKAVRKAFEHFGCTSTKGEEKVPEPVLA